jgi:hypothetical protein
MKYLRKFESFPGDNFEVTVKSKGIDNLSDGSTIEPNDNTVKGDIIYDKKWEQYLPKTFTINYHGKNYTFKKGNIMLVGDLVEISYDTIKDEWGCPDTLEFDLYFVKDNNTNKMRINVDITYGDLMACEFSIEQPNKVNLIQHTTYHSKFDPSNTVFALEDESLKDFVDFLNKISGFKLTTYDVRFLDKYDNWKE